MKKVFALVLTIALIATLTVASFAYESTDTKNLTATYLSGVSDEIVYSVNVAWGSLTFEFDAGTVTWSPDEMNYVADEGTAEWTVDSLTITVSNASNKAVNASMSVENLADTGVTVGIDGENSKTLASAVETKALVSDTFTLKVVDGVPDMGQIEADTLARATILFSKVA